MALYLASFDVPGDCASAFDYLADFSNAALWDPSVSRGVRVGEREVGLGTRFEVDVSFLGSVSTMTYEVTRYEPPHLVVFEASTPFVTSRDEISVVPTAEGVHVSYAARLTLPVFLRPADVALQAIFDRYGDRSRDGLVEGLGRLGDGSVRQPPDSALRLVR